jgi:hypothetical protein
MKQKLIELQGEIDKSPTTVKDFNRQKISKDIEFSTIGTKSTFMAPCL